MLIAATSIVKIAFADPPFIAPGQQGPDRNLDYLPFYTFNFILNLINYLLMKVLPHVMRNIN